MNTVCRVQFVLMTIPNREISRFVDHVGGNTAAAKILDCSPGMVYKLKAGERPEIKPKYIRTMYNHKGFKLDWLRLFDLD